jgi:hypothetical protein
MWKNAAIRGGLEVETVSVMPVSLVSSLKGVSKAEKYSESLCIMTKVLLTQLSE